MTDRTIKFTLVVEGDGVVREVQTTAAAFSQMGTASQAAAQQTQQGLSQVEQATRSAQASQSSFMAGLREQVALYGRSEGDVLRYKAAQAGVAQQASMLILQLENQKAAHQEAALAAMQEQAAQREAAAAKRAAEQASDAFVASLREQVATLGMSRTELLAYRAAQLGVVDQATPLIARLGESEQAAGRFGMTAGQTAQAMRMLPMQMTDIVTSLASGMPVWMVAIQQGGQLRDSFGSVGAVLGGIASLITPAVLVLGGLAAAAGLTALAFVQGQREASAYSEALIVTGNYAGVTSGQLSDMARDLARVNGTQAAHAEALAQLAGTGRIAGSVMAELGAAAVAMDSAIGKSVKSSVDEFVRLGEEPAKASAKLNEQYHFLTAAVYEQIAALERAGKTDQAAELAQRTYAQAMTQRAADVVKSLGWLETSWNAVGKAAKWAWDQSLNIGRPDSMAEQFVDQAQKVAKAYQLLNEAQVTGVSWVIATRKRYYETEKAALDQLGARLQLEKLGAEATGRLAAANEKAVAAQGAIDAATERYASSQKKLNLELEKTKAYYDAIRAVNPNDERLKGEQAMYASIRASFKDLGAAAKKELDEAAKAVKNYRDLVGDLTGKDSGLNSDFNNKLEVLRKGWLAGAEGAEGYRAAVQLLIEQQPFFIKGEQVALRLAQEASAARVASRAAEEASIADWQTQQTSAYQAAVRGSNEALAAAQREYDQYGMSKSQIAEITLATLRSTQAKLRDGSEGYVALQKQIDAQIELIDILRRGEARDLVKKAAADSTAAWERFAQDIERALTDSLYRSFEAGGGFFETFWSSIKNTLKSQVLKIAVQAVVGSVTGGLGLTGATASASTAVNGASTVFNGLSNLSTAGTLASLGATLGNFTAGLSAGFSQFTAGVNTFASLANASAVGGSTGLGIGLGAAGPYVAAALALYALAKATRGETRAGGQYGYGVTGTGDYGTAAPTFIQGPSGGQIEAAQVQSAIAATVAGINATLKAVGSAATLTGFQAALETSGNGRGGVYAGGTLSTGATFGEAGLGGGRSNYNGTLYETTSSNSPDAAAALSAFSTDLLQATIQALQAATDIPKAIQDMLAGVDAESLSAEAASQLIANVNAMVAFSAAVRELPFEQLKSLSYEAANGLVELMGGVQGLGAALGTYYEGFYTEAERQQQSVSNLQRVFTQLGLTMPSLTQSGEAARAQFRALVEAQDLNTEQGRQAYAALLNVSGAFAELTPLGVEVAASVDAVTGEVRALSQTMIDLGREHTSLQDQYDRLTLSQADYRAKTTAGYTAEEQAAAAANFALADQIAMLQEVARLDQQRASMENQLLQVQGDTAEIRRRELAALPESLRALQQRIYLLTDEAAAAQEATRQAQEVASARANMAQQLASLEMQLLQAEGNTAEIRRRELDALDPSLRAIQALIYARTDEVAAAQAAAQAAQATAQQRAGLETQLLQLQGNTASLRSRELAALDPANRALQQQIYALQDQATAAAAAEQAVQQLNAQAQALAQQAAAVAAERAGIEREYLQITGNTAALRALELAALDPANRALKERNFALQDQIAADQAASAAAQQAAQAQQQAAQAAQQAAEQAAAQAVQAAQQVAAEGMGIYKRLLQLQGDTVTLRALELEELDPVNRALQEQVYALEDAQAQLGQATQAQEAYTSAVADGVAFLEGAARDIAAYFGKLRASPEGLTSPASQLKAARAQFESQFALAAGGDRSALSGITGVADQLISAQRALAISPVEVRALIAQLETRLTALPALVRPEALIVNAIEQQTSATTQQAAGLNSASIDAVAAANRAAIAAAVADADRLVAAAQAQAATITANAAAQAAATTAAVTSAVSNAATTTVNALATNFDRLDTTANGLLDANELRAALGPVATDSVLRQVFATLDADGDGQISRLEAIRANTSDLSRGIASALAVSFDALDASVDGLLDAAELRAALGPLATDSVLRDVLSTVDADGDGQISRLEAIRANTVGIGGSVAAALASQFDRLDTTANGLLSADELRAALGPVATDSVLRQVFATLDADGDGQITRLEAIRANTVGIGGSVAAALASQFDRLDTTVNGLLDANELRAALGPLASDSVLRQVFATLDADGDGQISRLEAIRANTTGLGASIAASLASQFDRLDATANGLLDANELRAALGPVATDSVLRQVFATLDADGDGQISRLEAIRANTSDLARGIASALAVSFDALDTSVDGLLDAAELRAALGPLATDSVLRDLLSTVDADGDGQISRLEAIRANTTGLGASIAASLASQFDRLDATANGLLDANELRAALGPLASDSVLRQVFATLDADGDGQISRLEAILGAASLTADRSEWIGTNTSWTSVHARNTADRTEWIGTNTAWTYNLSQEQLATARRVLDYGIETYGRLGGVLDFSIESYNRLGGINAGTEANTAAVRTGNVILDTQLQSLYAQYALAISVKGLTTAVTNATAVTANVLQLIASGSAVLSVSTDKTIQPVDPGNPQAYFASGAAFLEPGVYQRPTTFGLGMFAEAGPEAIMPLANAGGVLGIRAVLPGDAEAAAELRVLRADLVALLARIENATTVGAVAQRGTEAALAKVAKFGVGVKPIPGSPLEVA